MKLRNNVAFTSDHKKEIFHGTDLGAVTSILRTGILRGGGKKDGRVECFFSCFKRGTKLSDKPWNLYKGGRMTQVALEPYDFDKPCQIVVDVEKAERCNVLSSPKHLLLQS